MNPRAALAAAALFVALPARPDPAQADQVYLHGRIWTGDARATQAEALAVRDGRIAAVGRLADVEPLIAGHTEVVDLEGAAVLPGLIDSHTHLIDGGLALASVQLRDADTPKEFARRIAAAATGAGPGEWILYGSWDHERWGGELPHRDWIDAVSGSVPVFVVRYDGHMGLANSAALEKAGIGDGTADPAGGIIARDGNGRATGVLKDTAMEFVSRVLPEPSERQLDEALALASERALSRGVTQIHDMGDWRSFETFRRAESRGGLRLRVYAFVQLAEWRRLDAFIAGHGREVGWLRWGGVKAFVDGSLGSSTAWFHEPYTDAPESTGLVVSPLPWLEENLLAASRRGMQLAVHAIGDRANDWMLEKAGTVLRESARQNRLRIEHAQHLSPRVFKRFAELGVVPSMQPYHAIDDGRWAERRIGAERIRRTYAFRSLLEAGAPVAFGTDWPVAPLDPFAGMYAAVTRRTLDGAHPGGWVPEQKIGLEAALRAYTSAGAHAGMQDAPDGTLAADALADFVVVDRDLFATEPERLGEVRVLRTVVGGRTQFEAGATAATGRPAG